MQLDDLDTALEITRTVPELEAEPKWKAIGDKALAVWRFDLARECFEKSGDLSALMLLLLSIGDRDGLKKLANDAGQYQPPSPRWTNDSDAIPVEKGQNNLAFATLLQLGDTKSCIDLLVKTQRTPEAAIFARTYAPRYVFRNFNESCSVPYAFPSSSVSKVVETWREDLNSNNRPKLAARIASPSEQPDAFAEGWEDVLEAERSSRLDGVLVDL